MGMGKGEPGEHDGSVSRIAIGRAKFRKARQRAAHPAVGSLKARPTALAFAKENTMRFSLVSSRDAPLALACALGLGLLGTTASAQARAAVAVNAIVAPLPPPPLRAEVVAAAPFHWAR